MASSNNLIRNEIREAVRDEVSRILGSPSANQVSRSNEPATRSTRQSGQSVETNRPRLDSASSGCNSSASSSGTTTLSFEDFYKMRERERQQGFKPPSKKKKSSSTAGEPKKVVNVDIKVGVATQSDAKIKMRRGKTHFVSVSSEADREEIIRKAIIKHASFDQSFDETLAYILLYPDFREVRHIPGTTELFKLSKYKQAIGKDYKRLTFYLISLDDIEECESDSEVPDNRSADWSRFGFLTTGNASSTQVLPKPNDSASVPSTSSGKNCRSKLIGILYN
mgnify:CR=1 FL=1